jgi:uncharacterized membrane protein YkvA (DUF1232 family)
VPIVSATTPSVPQESAESPRPPERRRGASTITASKIKDQALALRHEVLVLWLILKDPRTPWYSRAIAGAAAGYVLSPIQLIPSFIPLVGLMDDVAVLSAGMALIRWLTDDRVLRDARSRASQAPMRDPENIKPVLARVVTVAIAAGWILATIAAAFFLYRR